MSRFHPRTLALCLALGLACAGSVQAQLAPAQSSLPDFTGIVEQNASAVVHVEAKYNGQKQPSGSAQMMPGQPGQPGQGPGGGGDPSDILRRFFGMPMVPSPEDQKHTSVGSGFTISADGYILTNNHVVDHADEVTVRLQDRRTLKAKVVGTDPAYDIALLKVDAGKALPAVKIGDSRTLKPGQWVLAIGSPFDLDYTVTQGIVSAVGRNLGGGDQPYTSFIQTDVPINRGNSGGPLFNLQGQVVGINSQIYSNTGGYLGVAFSIPIDVAMHAVQQIKEQGFVTRGQLGVHVQAITDDIAKNLGLAGANGAAITDVDADSAAGKAGLQAGDVITAYNGKSISQAGDLPPLVGLTKPGTKVPVEIMRNGKKQTVQVIVGAAPRDENAQSSMTSDTSATSGSKALGLTVASMDSDTRKQLGLKAGEGVQISQVTGPVAATAGLQQGDVILMVNQQRVGSVAAFDKATASVKPGSTVLMLVRRGEASQFVGLTVPSSK